MTMESNSQVAVAMLAYAKRHGIEWQKPDGKPVCSTNDVWGAGKELLAWRVSGHAFGEKNASDQKTQRLCNLLFPPTFGDLVVAAARAEIGLHEVGYTNRGPSIDKFFAAALMAPGQAWCACGCCWCAEQAAQHIGVELTPHELVALILGDAAWVPNWLSAARERHGDAGWRIELVAGPDSHGGDFVILWAGAHIEVLVERHGDGSCSTIGFNTSPNGSQTNGGEVCAKTRERGDVTAIVRLIPPAK